MSTPFEKARKITGDYHRAIERIRSDKDLRPEAKAARIAEAHSQVDAELASLRGRYRADVEAERQRLRSAAFDLRFPAGTSAGDKAAIQASFRAAVDRVEDLTVPQQALNLLARARQSGDEVLALALAGRAYELGWTDLLNEHEIHFATQSAAVKRLWDFEQGQDIRSRLEVSAGLGSPARPPEATPALGKITAAGGDGA